MVNPAIIEKRLSKVYFFEIFTRQQINTTYEKKYLPFYNGDIGV